MLQWSQGLAAGTMIEPLGARILGDLTSRD
jgi:hypothetical protein